MATSQKQTTVSQLPKVTSLTDESLFIVTEAGVAKVVTWAFMKNYARGYTGSQSYTGSQGFIGSMGYTGSSSGFTGSRGAKGEPGNPGGYTGSIGALGFVGSAGGYNGSRGFIGYTGSNGIIGYVGSQGLPGAAASVGYAGSQGAKGDAGSPGGFVGSVGNTGSFGYNGSRGPIGYNGSQGSIGIGYTGSPGTGGGGGIGLGTRSTVNGTVTSLANAATGNTTIVGFKSYALYSVLTSTAAWVRIYSSAAARTADASRSLGSDPIPGAGVLAEVITTGNTSQAITPGVLGFNNEVPVGTNIYIAVTNYSGVTQNVTVTLTILQLEA